MRVVVRDAHLYRKGLVLIFNIFCLLFHFWVALLLVRTARVLGWLGATAGFTRCGISAHIRNRTNKVVGHSWSDEPPEGKKKKPVGKATAGPGNDKLLGDRDRGRTLAVCMFALPNFLLFVRVFGVVGWLCGDGEDGLGD